MGRGVLRDLRTRGLKPWNVTVADGHLGIWSALAEIFPSHRYNKRGTAEQWIKQAVKLTRRLFGSISWTAALPSPAG